MKKLAVLLILFMAACQPTPEQVKYAIYQTALSYTPTPGRTPTPLPTSRTIAQLRVASSEPTASENTSLRLPPYALLENSDVIIDTTASEEFITLVDRQARNLAIAQPFHWDYYATSKYTTWDDVMRHYRSKAADRKYTPRREEFNSEINMGLISFGKGSANIYVQYWAEDELILVLYKNVES